MSTGTLAPPPEKINLAEAVRGLEAINAEIERRLLVQKCEHLKGFIETFWHVVEPGIELRWNWHHDEIAKALENVERDVITNLVANVPPGTMKSLLLVFWRAKVLGKNPRARFLAGSYGSDLSVEHNVKLRDILQDSLYQSLCPNTRLDPNSAGKERFDTTAGGWSIATSVGGVGTGEHPDYVLIDDPLTALQAMSDAHRKAANNWIERTLSTRGVIRNVKVILVMQRLHEDDPTGYVLAKGGYVHICFPMRYEGIVKHPDGRVELPDPRDRRSVKGDLLWPEVFTEAKVRKLEIDLSPYGAAGQLQQRPAPEGGGLFKPSDFKYLEVAPAIMRVARGWDTAGTEDGGDWTVGVKIGEEFAVDSYTGIVKSTGRFVVLDVKREQLGPEGVDNLIYNTAVADGTQCAIREEKEGGSAGLAVIGARAKRLVGYDYAGVTVSGSKITRSKPYRAQVEAGNVYLLRAPWNNDYVNELKVFPVGKHDDQVDGSSCAFNAVLLEPAPQSDEGTWGR